MPTFEGGESEDAYVPSLCLYIAGPMRGKPGYNYGTFNEVADNLRADGWTVSNPAEHFGGDTSLPVGAYLREACRALAECDGIVLLHGWQESEGARMEYAIAQAIGLHMFTLRWMGNPDEGNTAMALRPMRHTPPLVVPAALNIGGES